MVDVGYNVFATALCAAMVLPLVATAPWPYGETFEGDGTYYSMGDVGGGNCAMHELNLNMYDGMIPVALNAEQYRNSEMCGACIKGKASGEGSGKNPIPEEFMAFVIDQCPECQEGDLDFSMSGDGRWDIEWEFVNCPRGDNNYDPDFLFEGSNDYYWKIQARGTKTPVKATRTQDNFFIIEPPASEMYIGKQIVKTKTIKRKRKKSKVERP